jgi:hypothetical protein
MNFYEFVRQVDDELLDNNLKREDVEIAWIDINCDDITEIEIVRVNGEVQLRVT